MDKIDHLREAQEIAGDADLQPAVENKELTLLYQSAIAHALIALVERLDSVTQVGLPVEIHK